MRHLLSIMDTNRMNGRGNATAGGSRASPGGSQLALSLSSRSLLPAIVREAANRGVHVEDSIEERDRRIVGEIGGLIAGLNRALREAAELGIEATVVTHYNDIDARRKRCVLAGRLKRIAFDVRI